jgi:hypothetical protein
MISVWGYEAVLSDEFHNRDPARLASQVLRSLFVSVALTHKIEAFHFTLACIR